MHQVAEKEVTVAIMGFMLSMLLVMSFNFAYAVPLSYQSMNPQTQDGQVFHFVVDPIARLGGESPVFPIIPQGRSSLTPTEKELAYDIEVPLQRASHFNELIVITNFGVRENNEISEQVFTIDEEIGSGWMSDLEAEILLELASSEHDHQLSNLLVGVRVEFN